MPPKKRSAADILTSLPETIPAIFDQAQVSTANHRKNCVALYKIHAQAALVTEKMMTGDGEATKLTGERAFSDVFVDMLNRVLVVKKGPPAAERVVKFIGTYVKYMSEKATEQGESETLSTAPREEDEDTPASRFLARLLSHLLKGFTAKDKTVRHRSVSLVAELISHLGELDEDVYSRLRTSLMERARDKEPTIRACAITALSKLLSGEDPEDLEDDEPSILDTLLDSICYDPASEVRRIALLNTPLLPDTLPTLLTRTRDVDIAVRALLYAHVLLPMNPDASASTSRASRNAMANPNRLSSPKQLTIEQRERVVKDGLGDREGKVRAGAGKMLAGWFDWAAESLGDGEGKTLLALIAFLKLFDVVGDGGDLMAVDALKSLFVTRPEVLDAIVFEDTYWRELTPESALLARAFIEFDPGQTQENRLEAAALPVVTAFAFYVQEACNAIFDTMEALEEAKLVDEAEDEVLEKLDAELADRVFVLGEVLKIAAKLDYTDEIGRRKVFQVVRDMLAHELFPETLMEVCLDVLKETTPSEREIIRIVVEIINELRDAAVDELNDGQSIVSRRVDDSLGTDNSLGSGSTSRMSARRKPVHEMTPEERAQADAVDARCLALCIATLKRVNGSFDENSTLEGILTDLIVPAVKRRELHLRERGLVALGLCCLIAKNMAMSSFQLFLNQVQSAPEELKLKVLQVIFDILMVYEEELLRRNKDIADRIITFLLQTLEVEESNAVQALLCIGISKLMINGLVTDDRVLTSLVLAYVSPVTSDNQELRQCLAYFLPVYCYSLPSNQSRMRAIFLTAFDLVSKVFEELEGDQEMITPLQFGNLFVDWTDPRKVAPSDVTGSTTEDVHVDLAVDILKALHDKDRADSDIKVFSQLLAKLYIPDTPDSVGLLCLGTLLEHLQEDVEDAATAKVLGKFKTKFKKQFGKEVENLMGDVGRYAAEERYREVCEVVGIDVPEVEEQDGEAAAAEPAADLGEQGEADEQQPEDDEQEEEEEAPRRHKAKAKQQVSDPQEEEEEEAAEDDDASAKSRSAPASRSPTPPPHRKKKAPHPMPVSDASTPPTTPHKKRQPSKRTRSPLRSPTMVSPEHKRVNNMKSPRKSRLKKSVDPGDPFVDSTNEQNGKAKGNSRRAPEPEPEPELSSEEEEEEVVNENSPPSDDEAEASEEEEPDPPPKRRAAPAPKKPATKAKSNGRAAPVRRSAAPAPQFDSDSEP
ncbi:hypothetical protein EIP91_001838 [Steccherinum ochraceum]|uniref:Nuclear condensin complex subunit 3 C-terminal domain-containing protein n=1 Tax=Steccherinum ochraceum TaxID=92696 RepID=A0A4R0RD87_9APHY|nr:hypothetical protein EIP91_001838 [Steccherinum ochraceum]